MVKNNQAGKVNANHGVTQQRFGSPSLALGKNFIWGFTLSFLLYGGYIVWNYTTEAEKMNEQFQDWERMQIQQDEEEKKRVRR
jgi:hypothetical protein